MGLDHAIYSEEVDCFVSQELIRLAEILQDYDSDLEMKFIPPQYRTDEDGLPYCIVHHPPGKKSYVVFYFGETDSPESILARIFEGDNARGDVQHKLDAANAAAQAFRLKEQIDARMEAADKFHFLATSRSNNFVSWGRDEETGKKIRLDSDRRRI